MPTSPLSARYSRRRKSGNDWLYAATGPENQLPQREISVLLTQVEVDAHDPAFSNPTKYIGPIYDEPRANALQAEKGWVFKADGKAFRRVVPSPQPKRIVESDAIRTLIARDHLVICNGGGGVPVVEKADGYHGIEAVIDKDLSAALLAKQIHADALLILTDADAVYLDWGKPTQRPLARLRRNGSAKCNSTPVQWAPKSPPARNLSLTVTGLLASARWLTVRPFSPVTKAR